MAKYIEREAILDLLKNKYQDMSAMPASYYKGFQYALKTIERIKPAADVAPLRHGRWVYNEDYEEWAEKYVCSVCNRNALTDGDYRHELTDYCPNCGAKMDMEEAK